ncbi:protein kinase [Amnibacterium flavum]|uniref:Serine/threonine protein kinase n=1 Tax=Amnibacterium flavum TaxID=2173173 RepID=A0A2V1HQJ8_9MICO|nr:protein kinase [Amnibacterium flavum]PVZ94815.1 serine/threonine protein kinase [Amnibacterium flavum]
MPLSFATNGMMYGRYRLIERIGAGGMATVWRASDEALDREVAVKVFTATATTPEAIRLQEREARTAAGHTHHGLVTLLDAGVDQSEEHGDRIFLVMELIDGFDLKVYLENNPLTARDIAYIGHDVAEALEYLHHHDIVHRDIKPANIMLSGFRGGGTRPRAKLTDFGIALPTDRITPAEGTTTGTAAYLSPEQANLDLVGPPTDIYALGLVLLECFTRQIAFPGDAVQSALSRLMRDPEIPETLDPEWRVLLKAMTAREPKARPTATEAMLSLRDLVISNIGRRRTDEDGDTVVPFNEASRIAAVRRLAVLDTEPEDELDRITSIAARALKAPVALISIVDSDRIWFKSRHGVTFDQIARDPGLSASAVLRQEPWIIEDAAKDPRSSENPLVMGDFGLRFYAGVPLTTTDGYSIGTLCVLGFEPRSVSDDDIATLVDLAAMAITRIEGSASALGRSSTGLS